MARTLNNELQTKRKAEVNPTSALSERIPFGLVRTSSSGTPVIQSCGKHSNVNLQTQGKAEVYPTSALGEESASVRVCCLNVHSSLAEILRSTADSRGSILRKVKTIHYRDKLTTAQNDGFKGALPFV